MEKMNAFGGHPGLKAAVVIVTVTFLEQGPFVVRGPFVILEKRVHDGLLSEMIIEHTRGMGRPLRLRENSSDSVSSPAEDT